MGHKPYVDREALREAQRHYFQSAPIYTDLTMRMFAEFFGCTNGQVKGAFPGNEWERLKREWIRQRLLEAMHDVYRSCSRREEFTLRKIYKAAAARGVARPGTIFDLKFKSYVGEEWRALRDSWPAPREVVLAKLDELVRANTPVAELTIHRVVREAGVWVEKGEWLAKPLREACRKLARQQSQEEVEIPDDPDVYPMSGGLLNLRDEVWDFRSVGGVVIRRDKLRPDMADVCWSLLREDLLSQEVKDRTVCGRHRGFIWAGDLLGAEVPDVRAATLEQVQRAWSKYDGSQVKRQHARAALFRLFARLADLAESEPRIDSPEMLRVAGWIARFATVRDNNTGGDFLSADEMDAVIAGCLTDIREGIIFVRRNPDWATMSTRPNQEVNAAAVVRWGVALMILVMAAAGLRRQSVVEIKLGDWAEVFPGVFALAWHHGRQGHEDVAVIPSYLIDLLQEYIDHTTPVRSALVTDQIFISGDRRGNWCVYGIITDLAYRLKEFTRRHGIERNGVPIALNALVMRRTYATRELYEGRSLGTLRLQLGHQREETTAGYVQYDRYEHPAYARGPLDQYGRVALSTWHNPVILEELPADERMAVFADKDARDQEVGLCRQDCCVKVNAGGAPPCSLCEHLATGPEFFPAWEREHAGRVEELRLLTEGSADGHLVAEKQYQLRRFEANYEHLKERSSRAFADAG